MSIRTVNIKAFRSPPYDMDALLQSMTGAGNVDIGSGDDVFYAEAPPFYSGITMRRWGSGSRAKAYTSPDRTVTETFSYDETAVFTRIPLSASVSFIESARSAYGSRDEFRPAIPVNTKCLLGLARPFPSRMAVHLGRQYLMGRFYKIVEDLTVGSREVNYDNPATPDVTTDMIGAVEFFTWQWNFSSGHSGDPRDPYDEFLMPVGSGYGIDGMAAVAASAISNWRDMRGTYSASKNDSDLDGSWDTNSVTHHVSLTIS